MRVKLIQDRDEFHLQVRSGNRKDPRVYATHTVKGTVSDMTPDEFLQTLVAVRETASDNYARVIGLQRYTTNGGA